MATLGQNQTYGVAPLAWVGHQAQLLRDAWNRRGVYNSVISELSSLSDRELDDIGITRGDFRDIARDAAENA